MLQSLKLSKNEGESSPGKMKEENSRALRDVALDIEKALRGEEISSSSYLFTNGTEFQKQVWRAVLQIPFAETRSYQWVAETVGRPKAVRAVANAIAANPFHVLVPCHRVCPKSGSLGGFAAGVELKRSLLDHEQAQVSKREGRLE